MLRYAPFHKGADEVVRILETARKQGIFKTSYGAILVARNRNGRTTIGRRSREGLGRGRRGWPGRGRLPGRV